MQGDKEREMHIRISPACQRGNVSVPRSQLAFLQYCVRPVYEALSHMFSEARPSSPLVYPSRWIRFRHEFIAPLGMEFLSAVQADLRGLFLL